VEVTPSHQQSKIIILLFSCLKTTTIAVLSPLVFTNGQKFAELLPHTMLISGPQNITELLNPAKLPHSSTRYASSERQICLNIEKLGCIG
jgi:hypothetical protein